MKKIIRRKIKVLRENLSILEVKALSKEVFDNLLKSGLLENKNAILSYMSIKGEVETSYINEFILKEGKHLLIPSINEEDELEVKKSNGEHKIGKYGIIEVNSDIVFNYNEIDIVLVPGVAFDKRGNRIGFGKGYYDRLLKKIGGVKIGLAYEFQIVPEFEKEAHDEGLDYICTESRVIDISKD